MKRFLPLFLLCALFLTGHAEPPAAEPSAKKTKKEKEERDEKRDRRVIDEFFAEQGPLPAFIIQFEPNEWEYLKKEPRRYAEAFLWEVGNDKMWKGVAVKCKGSGGAFRNPDQNPGLTFSMAKFKGGERWHGFLKWQLNNNAQDASLLNEQIAGEMARQAGVPAPRCAHALLKWQGRDLGLYGFKEAFDTDFLAHFFKDPEGDLYEGFERELEVNMPKELGDPRKRDNLKELIAAAQEGNAEKRWERLGQVLDIEEFLSFAAMESLLGLADGYCFNRNNYRVYFDTTTGKAQFFLGGSEQVFGDANFPVARDPNSLIGQAVMSNPAWKKAYAERAAKIYREVLKPVDWPARAMEVGAKVKADLEKVNPQWAKDYAPKIAEASTRVANRMAGIAKQLGDAPPPPPPVPPPPVAAAAPPPAFGQNGVLAISPEGWQPQGAAAAIDAADHDGKPCLHIRADGPTAASWRKAVPLPAGKYRLEVRAATAAVVPWEGGAGEGAGVRISGAQRTKPDAIVGDSGWQDLAYEINATGGDVLLVAELRANKGEVWFERGSFRIRPVK